MKMDYNFDFIPYEKQNHKYYYIDNDLIKYPDAWMIIAYSKRGPGKTYSVLDLCRRSGIKFIYMKRTIEDVKALCSGSGSIDTGAKAKLALDLSPFKPLNRDKGLNVRCFYINTGIAGFYETELDEEHNRYVPTGEPLGFACAVSGIVKFKGIDLSECDVLIYDEFIPQLGERVARNEGSMIMSFYDTLMRDRIQRGLPEIKFIALANATQVSNQLFDATGLIDDVVDLELKHQRYFYDPDGGVVVHKLLDEDYPEAIKDAETGMERLLKRRNPRMYRVEFEGDFAYDKLDIIKNRSLRGFKCLYGFKHHDLPYYVYRRDGHNYICKIPQPVKLYDLEDKIELQQFWKNYGFDLRVDLFEDRTDVDSYSAYNVIYNFKKLYEVS